MILVVEQIGINQVEPPDVFVFVKKMSRYPSILHLAEHALIGLKIVETCHTYLMGYRTVVLPVMINPFTLTDFPRLQVVHPGGVVIAVCTGGIVVKQTPVKVSPNHIQPMNTPVQTILKCLRARDGLETGQRIPAHMVSIYFIDLEKHAVGFRMMVKHVGSSLQGIR